MKRLLLLFLACVTLILGMGMSGCQMRYAGRNSHQMFHKSGSHKNQRHFMAGKKIKQRSAIWGRKHYGPRPYRHRGRQHY